ncbi:hypothetical protein [Synechocystis sp. PCC 7509]|uniref:hypothetical protein n=1 Tax=Synechocystis sp. PCC 7509 TaxID=927677 RepID=UPI0002ABF975|nr:hypothetical protein [Synechocystis sp. PCC 7509]
MLCEFTVYDDDNFEEADDESVGSDDEDFDEDYLENYVLKPDQEFISRCNGAIASLRNSLTSEGIAVSELDSWFVEGLKLLYAACFVDQFLNLNTATNFVRTLAILESEIRERDAHIQVVLKRFQTFPPVTEKK